MRFALRYGKPFRQRLGTPACLALSLAYVNADVAIARRQGKTRLASTDQFQIDLGKQFRVDQRTVFGADGKIEAEALAQFVERNACAGKTAARHGDGVDATLERQRITAKPCQFGIEEFQIEFRIVDDKRCIANEIEKLLDDACEYRGALELVERDPMDAGGFFGNVAFRMDEP